MREEFLAVMHYEAIPPSITDLGTDSNLNRDHLQRQEENGNDVIETVHALILLEGIFWWSNGVRACGVLVDQVAGTASATCLLGLQN